MDFDHSKTARGFVRIHFPDLNGETCSLQESSRMDDEPAIRLGAATLKVKVLDQGWHDVDLESFFPGKSILGNEQMHLTQSQVRDLLPLLGHFVRTGYLPDEPLPAPTRAEDGVLPCPFCGGTQADGTLEFSHGQKYVVHAESEVFSAFRGVLVPRAQWNTRAPMSVEEKSE